MLELAVCYILLSPLILIFNTLKHEAAHAVGAWLCNYEVTELTVFPVKRDGKFYLGWTAWQPRREGAKLSKEVYLAPYLVNLGQIGLLFYLRPGCSLPVEVYNFVMLLLCPLVDTLWNIGIWLFKRRGDFAEVFSR